MRHAAGSHAISCSSRRCYRSTHCAYACGLGSTDLNVLSGQARESAQRWETRASDLQQRYGKVDLAEHQRVLAELDATKAELQQLNRQLEDVCPVCKPPPSES